MFSFAISIIMAYFMVHKATVDEASVTGFETSVDVEMLTREMEVLFPEIVDVAAGQITRLDENGNLVERKLILLETDVDMEDGTYEEKTEKIRTWLHEKYGDYDVEFE